jgi:hypothetical protein
VDVDDQVPVLVGHLEQQVVAGDAGVVDQDVDAAELLDDPGDRGVDRGGVADVGADADVLLVPGRGELRGRRRGSRLVEVEDRDRRALLGEPGRAPEADALRRARDDRDPSVVPTPGPSL